VSVRPFEEFYVATWPRLLRPLVLITTDRADAEDVLQEAFMKAARDWTRVGELDQPGAWVRRVAINAAIDVHRRRTRQRSAYQQIGEARSLPSDAMSLEVAEALRELPVAERQVLVCHYLLSMPVAEIADELARPSGTVKAQLVRGRKQLADRLRFDLDAEIS
jgi:RNA polymerase sigma-70 factor (ECF subfamily)